ncbi:MAG: hypothetical protein NTW91_08510 [Verrucomicrobia bacterium]|nr:hypothetical protein [Verrucomicrobiota bacterium]
MSEEITPNDQESKEAALHKPPFGSTGSALSVIHQKGLENAKRIDYSAGLLIPFEKRIELANKLMKFQHSKQALPAIPSPPQQ